MAREWVVEASVSGQWSPWVRLQMPSSDYSKVSKMLMHRYRGEQRRRLPCCAPRVGQFPSSPSMPPAANVLVVQPFPFGRASLCGLGKGSEIDTGLDRPWSPRSASLTQFGYGSEGVGCMMPCGMPNHRCRRGYGRNLTARLSRDSTWKGRGCWTTGGNWPRTTLFSTCISLTRPLAPLIRSVRP